MRCVSIMVLVLGVVGAPARAAALEIHVTVPQTMGAPEERAAHAELIRRTVRVALRGVDAHHADVVVSKLAIDRRGERVEVTAIIEVLVSTRDGIRALATGRATFAVTHREYRPARATALRRDALAQALAVLGRRLRAYPRPA